jgi:hypothetical protein
MENTLPDEIINHIIMMSRPTYNYMDEMKRLMSKYNNRHISDDSEFIDCVQLYNITRPSVEAYLLRVSQQDSEQDSDQDYDPDSDQESEY